MITKELLRELHDRRDHALGRLLEGIKDYVVVLDAEGRLLYVNHIVSQESWNRVRGTTVFLDEWLVPEAQRDIRAALTRAFERGESSEFDIRGVDPATRKLDRWYHSRMHPLRHGNETYAAVYISTDITDRRNAEEERRRLEGQLRTAQKLESLGVLAGGIAHDFNNILVSILGYAELVQAELPPGSKAQAMLAQVKTGAQKAAGLCRQMLAYSGKGRFIVQPIDLNETIREIAALLEVSISKKAHLRMNLAEALPPVEADAAQINQIVLNLVTNASEALKDGSGSITLATGRQHCDAEYLASQWIRDGLEAGEYVWLEVTDTGCGMDAETLARVFEPFFSTKFVGRGLGMAAVLGIVRGHKGAIRAYSEPGRGSAFKVLLPSTGAPALPSRNDAVSRDVPAELKILVADDEPSILAFARDALERMKCRAVAARDGREAVDRFAEDPDGFALVLLDMTMPVLGGQEVFHELRRIRPGVRILLTSGYDEREATHRFAGRGLAGFLQKPYTLDQFKRAINEALRPGTE